MRRHGERAIYVIGEDEIHDTLCQLATGCPVSGAAAAPGGATSKPNTFKFDRLCEARPCDESAWASLAELGLAMNAPPADSPEDSNIPAGYTYLGQFIAHELTFDKTPGLQNLDALPAGYRSPTLDLDSLYGDGPGGASADLYQGAELKVGTNSSDTFKFPNDDCYHDLPRREKTENGRTRHEALLADERNEENLPLAQMHLAFIKFHNGVVKLLRSLPGGAANEQSLYERARRVVVRHFQRIVLDDFLPRVVDPDILKAVRAGDIRCDKLRGVRSKDELFMPVEFSAAAFRLGHSMVRPAYEFNEFHQSRFPRPGPAILNELFRFTQFSGDLGGKVSLRADWVIDWRRFFAFPGPDRADYNLARKIDTKFDLHLNEISEYPHQVPAQYRAITVRNLIRGCILKLATGQAVARSLGERPMSATMLASGSTKEIRDVLERNCFLLNTPLWFYILKEAELFGDGNSLGPVGSRIVAETFYTILKYSEHSIILDSQPDGEVMLPARAPGRFDMVDMLKFMGEINPIGRYAQ